MNNDFIQVSLDLPDMLREPAIALLADAGYEAFHESEEGLEAFIAEKDYDKDVLETVLGVFPSKDVDFTTQLVKDRNWNAEWEAQYEGTFVDDFCQVIASFKTPEPGFEHTIVIDPKMSFGTGHHETTRLMVRQLRKLAPTGKSVLDMGSGTCVLAMLASQMGADPITAIDIDKWSYENATENLTKNDIHNVTVIEGDAHAIPDTTFDIILANINRNVLLADCGVYADHLKEGGILVISGFYRESLPLLENAFKQHNLHLESELQENNWLSLLFIKR